jgi:alpha-mannosidase
LGFSGALHFTLDDGKFPSDNQSRIQWEGFDGDSIEAVGRVPVDVSRADAFLRLPERLGNSMDLDHVATVVLAHWPGQSSPWYDALRRVAEYSNVLGTFATIDDYFQQTSYSG